MNCSMRSRFCCGSSTAEFEGATISRRHEALLVLGLRSNQVYVESNSRSFFTFLVICPLVFGSKWMSHEPGQSV